MGLYNFRASYCVGCSISRLSFCENKRCVSVLDILFGAVAAHAIGHFFEQSVALVCGVSSAILPLGTEPP